MKPKHTPRVFLFIIFFMPLFSVAQEKTSKVKLFVQDDASARNHLLKLLEIDHFITDSDGGIISEIDESLLNKLKRTTYRYEILVPDVTKELDSLNKIYYASLNKPTGRVAIEQPGATSFGIIKTPAVFEVKPTFGGYYSFTEMEAAMDALVASYPTLATKTSIGTSVEGRNIWVIKISDNAITDELNEPEILYMGLQHAREAIGGSSMIFFMQYLCERYALDNRMKDLIDNREIFIIPCLNPDGWEYNRTSMGGSPGGGWRKNRSDNGGGIYGVDLNRNWGIDWANCSAPILGPASSCGSGSTSMDTYWGPSVFSEPETQAVRNFTKAHHLVAGFDQHSVGPYYSIPFGRKALHTMGTKGNQFFTAVPALMGTYNGMRAADSYDALGYEVAGGFKDWMLMGEIGTGIGGGLKDSVWAMTGEGAGGGNGFWPPASQILNLCKSMCYQNIQLAFASGSYVDIQDASDIVLTALSGTVSFNIKRLGLGNEPVTVSLIPLENMESAGASEIIGGMIYYENFSGSINYTLPATLGNGQRVKYAWKVETGGYTFSDTVTKFLNPVILFNDNMEGAYGATWSGTWVYTTSGGYNSNKALSESAAGTLYGANQNLVCTYKNSLNLSDATAAYISFWTRHRIENFRDKCQLQVSANGTTWVPIAGRTTIQEPGTLDGSTLNGQPAFTGVRDSYTHELFDLEAYKGVAALQFRFVFTSDNDPSSFKFEVDDGIYIDDIKIIKSTTPLLVLPVRFTSFTGVLVNNQTVSLKWEAVEDQEHDYFMVEHATDGIKYTSLGIANKTEPYHFIHQQPATGNNFYRIRQVDKNGSISYSKVVNIVVSKPTIITMYPNPVKDKLTLKLTTRSTGNYFIQLTDVQGQVMYAKTVLINPDTIDISIDMKLFQPQVYMLKLTNGKGEEIFTKKIMKH